MRSMSLFKIFVSILAPNICLLCKKEPEVICSLCSMFFVRNGVWVSSTQTAALVGCWAVTEYSSYSKDLVHSLKFNRLEAAGLAIAKLMTLDCPAFPSSSVVVFIPTANKRIRQRGYDQAKLIACNFAKSKSLPFYTVLSRNSNLRQVGASRKKRLTQMKHAFTVKNPRKIRGKTIILIDDVMTTGSTLNSAAEALKEAGAKQVIGFVFAYKP